MAAKKKFPAKVRKQPRVTQSPGKARATSPRKNTGKTVAATKGSKRKAGGAQKRGRIVTTRNNTK